MESNEPINDQDKTKKMNCYKKHEREKKLLFFCLLQIIKHVFSFYINSPSLTFFLNSKPFFLLYFFLSLFFQVHTFTTFMSWLNKLVGRAPKKLIEEEVTKQAHSSIHDATTSIAKRQAEMKRQIDGLTNEARTQLKAGNKKGALQTMKRKKLVETHLVKLDPHVMNLEVQKITLEGMGTTKTVFSAMKSGAAAMKVAMPSADDVTDTMEELNEAYTDHDEISDMLGAPMGSALSNMDDDELASELNDLETDLEFERESALFEQLNMAPKAPTSKIRTRSKQEQEEEEEEEAEEATEQPQTKSVSSSSSSSSSPIVILGHETMSTVQSKRSTTSPLSSSSSSSSSSNDNVARKSKAPSAMTAAELEAKQLEDLAAFMNS